MTRSYARVCTANIGLMAARRVAETRQEALAVSTRLAQGGLGSRMEVERARAAAYNSSALIPQIIAERQAALLELAALMGRAPSQYPKEIETCDKAPSIMRPIPVGDGAAFDQTPS